MPDVPLSRFEVGVATVTLEQRSWLCNLGRYVEFVLVPVPPRPRWKYLTAPFADYGTIVLYEVLQQLVKYTFPFWTLDLSFQTETEKKKKNE